FAGLRDDPSAEPQRYRVEQAGEPFDDLYAPIAIAQGDGMRVVAIARVGLSLRNVREQVWEMARWGLLLGVGMLLAGVVAAAVISRQVSRPIQALIIGAERLRAGELEYRVKVGSRDELGAL